MYDKMHGLLSPLRVSAVPAGGVCDPQAMYMSGPSYALHTRSASAQARVLATKNQARAPASAPSNASSNMRMTRRQIQVQHQLQEQRHSMPSINSTRPTRTTTTNLPMAGAQQQQHPSVITDRMVQSATFYKARARGRRDRSNTDSATINAMASEDMQRASMGELRAAAAGKRVTSPSSTKPSSNHPNQAKAETKPTATSNPTKKEDPACGWRVAVDPKSKRPYYYHVITRVTTWKKPAELVNKEKQERSQFFATMEHNIRAKLRKGDWFRDSLTSPKDVNTTSTNAPGNAKFEDDGELSSGSTSCRSSWSSNASTASASRSSANSPATFRQSESDLVLPEDTKTKMPLFRTLSSYETPEVSDCKTHRGGNNSGRTACSAIPSPIQERVRLAVMDSDDTMPRMSDLESYTRPHHMEVHADALHRGAVKAAAGNEQPPPLRRRSNSTSTIYVPMGTLNAPDQQGSIQCVSTVLRAHLMEAQAAPIVCAKRFDVFLNRRDQILNVVPSLKEIGAFIGHVFSSAQMESECIIMSLIYVERLLKATVGALQLQPCNWRSIVFCSMVMASKVWDDLSMCNADFSKIWPELSLKEINDLELTYLGAVEYNVRVSAMSYAKYYFNLRSMCATMGLLESFDESAPLNLEGARKMQVLSEDYQERSKLLPEPRRRSVTITTPSADRAMMHRREASPKTSPAASIEQLVKMQVRVAGSGGQP